MKRLIVVALALAGCVSPVHGTWTKASMTETQQKADAYACEKDALAMVGNNMVLDGGRGYYSRCMEARGYNQ